MGYGRGQREANGGFRAGGETRKQKETVNGEGKMTQKICLRSVAFGRLSKGGKRGEISVRGGEEESSEGGSL